LPRSSACGRAAICAAAAAELLAGEPGRALAALAGARESADVLSDRAAIALVAGEAPRALQLADAALRSQPQHPQARWNRALALRDLGLRRSAAAAFDELAARREAGWGDEARKRAQALWAQDRACERVYRRAQAAGEALIAQGTPLPEAPLRELPDVARQSLYRALQAAPSRDRLVALLPLAAQLDRASNGHWLSDEVRAATAAFPARPPAPVGDPWLNAYAALAAARVQAASNDGRYEQPLRDALARVVAAPAGAAGGRARARAQPAVPAPAAHRRRHGAGRRGVDTRPASRPVRRRAAPLATAG
jgi:hypothetical protein